MRNSRRTRSTPAAYERKTNHALLLSSSVPPANVGRYTVFGTNMKRDSKTELSPNSICCDWVTGILVPMLVVAALTGGCRDPLLTDDEPRSQYDRYDALRDQRAPARVEDAFGTQKPNLRGRLLIKQ